MKLPRQSKIVYGLTAALVVAIVASLVTGRWSLAFVSAATIALSWLPLVLASRFNLKLPYSFLTAIAAFVFATIFLGEAFQFYTRYWWWDILLHGSSAIAFGLIGFVFVFMLFEGDRYAAPPSAMAFFGFCFAVSIGSGWEIFEYAMDETFGMNMQKSGLPDTMGDLIVNMVGAAAGASAGFFFLKGREFGGASGLIEEFIRLNRDRFRRFRETRRERTSRVRHKRTQGGDRGPGTGRG